MGIQSVRTMAVCIFVAIATSSSYGASTGEKAYDSLPAANLSASVSVVDTSLNYYEVAVTFTMPSITTCPTCTLVQLSASPIAPSSWRLVGGTGQQFQSAHAGDTTSINIRFEPKRDTIFTYAYSASVGTDIVSAYGHDDIDSIRYLNASHQVTEVAATTVRILDEEAVRLARLAAIAAGTTSNPIVYAGAESDPPLPYGVPNLDVEIYPDSASFWAPMRVTSSMKHNTSNPSVKSALPPGSQGPMATVHRAEQGDLFNRSISAEGASAFGWMIQGHMRARRNKDEYQRVYKGGVGLWRVRPDSVDQFVDGTGMDATGFFRFDSIPTSTTHYRVRFSASSDGVVIFYDHGDGKLTLGTPVLRVHTYMVELNPSFVWDGMVVDFDGSKVNDSDQYYARDIADPDIAPAFAMLAPAQKSAEMALGLDTAVLMSGVYWCRGDYTIPGTGTSLQYTWNKMPLVLVLAESYGQSVDDGTWDPSVIAHEMGHVFMWAHGQWPPDPYGGDHEFCKPIPDAPLHPESGERTAWAEGWAHLFGQVVLNDDHFLDRLINGSVQQDAYFERPDPDYPYAPRDSCNVLMSPTNPSLATPAWPLDTIDHMEIVIAYALWDLWDAANDFTQVCAPYVICGHNSDATSGATYQSIAALWTITMHYNPQSLDRDHVWTWTDFYEGLYAGHLSANLQLSSQTCSLVGAHALYCPISGLFEAGGAGVLEGSDGAGRVCIESTMSRPAECLGHTGDE